ncbi:MAG TPA: hypothetical protein VGQ57_09105, partial [Polyangiaceae bacterium]|nr:hypothetical protein [Polyangiaceae bacterium]
MTHRKRAWPLAFAGLVLVALPCRATPPAPAAASARLLSSDARAEARLRFDRGLALYETADFTGALAEFQRAYELSDHPLVLYNLALVQAKLDHAAEAVDAFERLEARGLAEIGVDRARRAHEVHEEQRLRIGTLELVCDVPNATIQIDNVDLDP